MSGRGTASRNASNPRASSSRWFDAPADPAANFVLTALRETGDLVAAALGDQRRASFAPPGRR